MSSKDSNVLLFTDDQPLLEMLRQYLTEEGYTLTLVDDIEALKQQLLSGRFPVVISEAHLLAGEGDPVLHYVYSTFPDQKIILITDFLRISESKRALDLGCDRFLPKPVTKADLMLAVMSAFTPVEKVELNEAHYARVGIEDFIYGQRIAYPIYVRWKDQKFTKVAHSGQNIDLDLIENLKARGLKEVWLEKEAFNDYVRLSQRRAQDAASNADLNAKHRARLVAHACEVATENLRLMGISKESLLPARDTLVAAMSVIGSGPSALALLESIDQQEPSAYTHAVSCGVLCGLLSRVMGWVSERHILALALGGYLHEVGMNQLPLDLQTLAPEEMTAQQLVQYHAHPKLGADALKKISGIPQEVVLMVQQHHENNAGTGFPDQLPGHKIFPMAKIVSLVDCFVKQVLRLAPKDRVKGPDILADMVAENPNHFEEAAVIALQITLVQPDLKKAAMEYSWAVARKTTPIPGT